MTSTIASPPFLQNPGTPLVPWAERRRVFQAYVDVAAGDTARPGLKKSLLLNALGVESLEVYWTLRNAQDQAESVDRTKARRMNTLALLENHFKAPSNEVLERHYILNAQENTGGNQLPTTFLLYRQWRVSANSAPLLIPWTLISCSAK
ncbi:hypothetical protein MRX96_006175 [Rhipicephalus microplus]